MSLPKGIRPKGNRYEASVMVAGRREWVLADTPEQAEAERAILRARLAGLPVSAPIKPWSLSRVLLIACEQDWRGTKWGQIAEGYVREFIKMRGDLPIDQVTTLELDQWVAGLGCHSSTVNRRLAAISHVLTLAHDRGLIDRKPKVPRRRIKGGGRIRYLSSQEERAVIATLMGWGLEGPAECVQVLLDTGCRVGSLFAIKPEDVDLKAHRLTFWYTKGDEPYSVPLTTRAHSVFKRWLQQANGPARRDALVPCTRRQLEDAWERARCHLGLENDKEFVLHSLRHTCASRLVQRGCNLAVVQKFLGHKTLSMTMRYAHLAPSHLEGAARLLEGE